MNTYSELHEFLNNRSYTRQETKVTFTNEASETRDEENMSCF